MQKSNLTLFIAALGVAIFGMGILLFTTTPDSVGPQGVLLFFGLLLTLFTVITYGVVSILNRKAKPIQKAELSIFIALGPLALVALTTLKQIRPVDVILIIILELFLIFYVRRGRIREEE